MSIREALRKAEWSGQAESRVGATQFHQETAGESFFGSSLEANLHSNPHSANSSFAAESPARESSQLSGSTARSMFSSGTSRGVFAPTSSPRPWAGPTASSHREIPRRSELAAVATSLFEEDAVTHYGTHTEGSPIPWRELAYLGSVADCYLFFRHTGRKEGSRLLVLDQHAFHERIIYERLCNNQDLLKRSQGMLVPEVLTFAPDEISSLKECQALMAANGFKLAFVADDTVELQAVPMLLAKADAESLLAAFIKRAESSLPLEDNTGLGHEILSTMACHAAVRAGEPLGENELKALLLEAQDVDFFHNCPHGRRVFRWWESAQIGRWFDR